VADPPPSQAMPKSRTLRHLLGGVVVSPLRLWQCPRCGTEVAAVAVECGHRCPADRHKWVRFTEVEETETDATA